MKFQEGNIFLYEIDHYLEITKSHDNDILDDDDDDPLTCYTDHLTCTDTGTLVGQQVKRGHMRKKENINS